VTWLQKLSFDAPLVAVLWCALLMKARGMHSWAALSCLGLVVWGVYLLDRWLDGDRHWREAVLVLSALAAAGLAAFTLPRGIVVGGIALSMLVAAYLGAVHTSVKTVLTWKEVLVGITFAAGTWLPVLSRHSDRRMLAGLAAFACVCTLNCITCEWGARQEVKGRWRRDAASLLGPWLVPLSGVTGVVLLLFSRQSAIFAACGISAVLLLFVNLHNPRTALGTRLWADAAMLSPILFLVQ